MTLFWTALFVCSLLMQYANFVVAPSPVQAAHNEGIFELDGNALDQAAAGADWQNGPEGAADAFFVGAASEASANDDTYFTTGGSKDENDIPSWAITDTGVPDKNELLDAYAAVYQVGGDTWVYFGADRFDNDGTAQIGFWFFQDEVGIADGDFTGAHVDGDVLILSEYTNGGVVSLICAYEWDGSGGGSNIAAAGDCDPATSNSNLNLVAAGVACDVADGTFEICAVTNAAIATAPWPFTNKDGDSNFDPGQFFEGGINLSDMFGGDPPCFGTFLAETRSSAETDAQLKDFALGSLDTCVPPDVTTTSSVSTADFGQQVTDTANLSGSQGPVTGTVDFFICTPTQVTAAGCPEGAGTQVGSSVAIVAGAATSSAYTVGLTSAAVGKYCWRAEYNPAADSDYLETSHTNATTECFTVAPATIDIDKVANPAGPVSAGDAIGFDITVTNNGSGTALGVSVTDNLPAGVDWTLGAVTGDTTGVSCNISGSVGSEVLSCTDASMAADDSFSVHVSATTDATDCGTINNTASVTTTNDGSDSDPASVQVLCPDVKVTKTPDGGSVNAGDPITWTIKVENLGPGVAKGVTLTDNLPAGIDWSESEADCTITGAVGSEQLNCTVGDLASGASKTYQVTGTTDAADCGVVNNTGTASATNEPSNLLANNTDSGSVEVLCAEIDIEKTANPAGPVNAGDVIGFDITVTNNGAGTATNVAVSDNLPAGFTWSVGAPTGDTTGVSCNIDTAPNPDVLSCTDASMAAGDSFTVHISATSDAADCGTVNNTASVTTGNDGSDEDSASVVINCPDLEVVKSGNGPLNAGDDAVFTITVTNHGPGTAYDVTLSDQLPSGSWTLGGADAADCSIDGANLLTCNFGDLADDASATITLTKTTTADDCGTIHNEVTVAASNEPENDQFPNTDDADIVVNCPDLEVVKDGNGPLNAGEVATFTITVTNHGPGTAYDVTLSDQLPAGTWTLGGADAADCSIDGANLLTCNFGDLADDASASITVSKTTTADDCGTIDNEVTVAASNEDTETDQFPNTDDAEIVVNCPDVTVDKTGSGTISAGELASYTITVTNLGPGTAFDVTLSDQLPAGSWTLGGPDAGDCSIDGSNLLTCDFGTLVNGAEREISLSRETTAEDCGTLPNLAEVAASNEAEEDTGNNSDDHTITVLCAEIVITKTADADSVSAGDPIGFTITVTNTGEGSAFGVTVTDTLPTNGGLSWSIDGGANAAECDIAAGILSCDFGTMASGTSKTVHISSPTTADTCGTVNNTAAVTTTNDGSDEDDSSIDVLCPDVVVIKSAAASPINAGDTAGFSITVWNDGDGEAKDVVLSDDLPAGVDWTLGAVTGDTDGVDCEISGAVGSEVLTCTDDSMSADDAFTVSVSGAVGPEDCGTLPNLASAEASNEAEGDTENNSDDASIDVLCAEIGIEKVADADEVVAGEQIGFTITVSNGGAGVAYDVEVMDVLPAGVTWSIDGAANGFSIVGGNLIFGPADLAAGASVSVHIVAGTDRTDCGVIDNTASVTTSNDGEDEAADSVSVRCPEIDIDKTSDDADGIVGKGQTVTYTINVSVMEGPVTDAVLTDVLPAGQTYVGGSQTADPAATTFEVSADGRTLTWTWNSLANDGAVVTYDVTIDADAAIGDQTNVAEICVSEVPDCEDDDETVTVPDLTITKSFTGNTGGVFESEDPEGSPLDGTPIAEIGDVLTYTLTYDLTNGPVHNGVITDTLPLGLAYVTGSATGNAEFTFDSFDATTRTLTWTAPLVSADGSVTYQVLVLEGSADLPQPLINVATIDSDETPPDDDERQVLVDEPPLAITPPPTLPPTSTIDNPSQGQSNPGFALMLALLGLAGFTLAVGFITPVPARVRRQDRRG